MSRTRKLLGQEDRTEARVEVQTDFMPFEQQPVVTLEEVEAHPEIPLAWACTYDDGTSPLVTDQTVEERQGAAFAIDPDTFEELFGCDPDALDSETAEFYLIQEKLAEAEETDLIPA